MLAFAEASGGVGLGSTIGIVCLTCLPGRNVVLQVLCVRGEKENRAVGGDLRVMLVLARFPAYTFVQQLGLALLLTHQTIV